LYYEPAQESEFNLRLMRLIDEYHMQAPAYGRRTMTAWLRRQGHPVNPKRIERLMKLMGLEAIYPKPKTTQKAKDHKIYPYLLKNYAIKRPNQVWSTDITYIPMPRGFMYLVAIMDWHSRYVLSWALSNTLERFFCLQALDEALQHGQPEIFNSDQGSQFTSADFTTRLEQADIRISMDGRGRAFDNIFVERLWRTVKYEHVYLYRHDTVPELYAGLASYFHFYNHERLHQSLDYCTPAEVHFDNRPRLLQQ
jgi:putative transposase